jgi:hypothetical protein
MKQLIISVFSLVLLSTACTKDQGISNNTVTTRSSSSATATVTKQGLGCDLWGINVDGRVYPAFNLPEQFKTEGRVVSIVYELMEDLRDCPAPCCGGIWANIISIH